MKVYLKYFYIALISVIFISFQNCGQVPELDDDSSNLNAVGSNGDIYDGKLTQIYQHNIPNHTCEGEEVPYQEIKVYSNKIKLIKNSDENCNSVSYISQAELQSVMGNKDLLLYNQSVFKKEFEALKGSLREPNRISPSHILEAWCQSYSPQRNFRQVVVQSRVGASEIEGKPGQIIQTDVISKDTSVKNLTVERGMNVFDVYYYHTSFSLVVDTATQVSQKYNEFKGDFKRFSDGAQEELRCQLGNDLDPLTYPLKFTGDSRVTVRESRRTITSGQSFTVTGQCDHARGGDSVSLFGNFSPSPVEVPCVDDDEDGIGEWQQQIDYSLQTGSGRPGFSSSLGKKVIQVEQFPAMPKQSAVIKQ